MCHSMHFFPTQNEYSWVKLFQCSQAESVFFFSFVFFLIIIINFWFCYSSQTNLLAQQKESSLGLMQQRHVSILLQPGSVHPCRFMWTRREPLVLSFSSRNLSQPTEYGLH